MKPELTIKSVSILSGIGTHTLRAWERRYRAIAPLRTATGRRRYTPEDVERLKLMAALTRSGHAIGGIARLSRSELENLRDAPSNAAPPSTPSPEKSPERVCRAVIDALKVLDLTQIDRELSRARLNFSAMTIALNVFSPLMAEIGRLVEKGALGIGEEHMVSALLRDQMGQILQSARQSSFPRKATFLVTTQEGNLHEFGILLAAVLCVSRGFGVNYLGPNLPAGEIARIAKATNSSTVLIGSTPLPPGALSEPIETFCRRLKAQLPKSVALWVGGETNFPLSPPAKRIIRHIPTLQDLDQSLNDL